MPTLIEIKAKCTNPDEIRKILSAQKARFIGEDHQIDTYFNVIAHTLDTIFVPLSFSAPVYLHG